MSETPSASGNPDIDRRWAELAAPFKPEEVEKLPKPLYKDAPKRNCTEPDRNGYSCGGYHQMPAIHLDYVGHAGVTMRLNQVDPEWTWEPMYRAVPDDLLQAAIATGNESIIDRLLNNAPMRQTDGGLWIRLTVLGVTRPGFGDAGGKVGTNAVKEIIGDAIRNAAMRFGVGTYLWSKSEAAQALAVREAGADVDAGDHDAPSEQRPSRGARSRPPRQREPENPRQAESAAPDTDVADLDAEQVARDMAAADTLDRLGQIWALAGRNPVLSQTDVAAGLTADQLAVAGLTPQNQVPLGRWAFACRDRFVRHNHSIDTAVRLDPANS